MTARPLMRALAGRLGIETGYESALEHRRVDVPDSTLETLIAARGHDAMSEAAAREALEGLERIEAARLLEPFRVVQAGSPEAGRACLRRLAATGGDAPRIERASLLFASGQRLELDPALTPDADGSLVLVLPTELPLGEHRLEVELTGGGGDRLALQQLVVVPERAWTVEEALGASRGFGIHANLYSIRGPRGLGHGDFGDLRALVSLAARHGGSFVGLNPLHAGSHAPGEASPYSPLDRLAFDPIYLELERIPEYVLCTAARGGLDSPLYSPLYMKEAARLRAAPVLDRVRVWHAKRALLAELFACFQREHARPRTARGRAFEQACAEDAADGGAMRDHSTFMALAEWLAQRGESHVTPWDWRGWPEAYRSARSPAVARFSDANPDAVEFHAWMQWELARQLEAINRDARADGLALGLCADLALGCRPGGVETWRDPSLFVLGVEAGAPPDDFAREGQTWGFPPLDPDRLVDGRGHSSWLALLRAVTRHAGALRIDHVLSLSRLFWVPEGAPPAHGTYVRYPEHELLGLIALESRRRRVVVIGEDLGTVPEGFSARIRERGLLSTRLLYFEREDGGFAPATRYPQRALVSVGTHDLTPLAGWLTGEDIALRSRIAPLAAQGDPQEAHSVRAHDRRALETLLRAEGHLNAEEAFDGDAAVAATARFLGTTPGLLVGLSLDDLAGETLPVNLPGVPESRYPSWTRRMSTTLEEIESSGRAREAFKALAETGRARASRVPPPRMD